MPTSAAGNRPRRIGHLHDRRSCGFTLLELMVVIAIMAMATAGVALALRDSSQTSLDREADRLAALFESARAQSRASGIAVRWRITPEGPGNFVFDGLPPDSLPTVWLANGISAQPVSADGVALPALQLGPDPIIAAKQVQLSTLGPPAATLRISTDGLRPFTVVIP